MEEEGFNEEISVARSVQCEDELEELIKNLEDQCKISEKAGNFLEADKIYQRILELKKQVQRKKQKTLAFRQQNEASDIEIAYQEDLKRHQADWQEKLELFRESCKEAEDQLMQKQSNEFETTKKQLEESIPVIPKHSPELLNLRRIQDTLVKNKEYKEAHLVQQQMIDLEERLKSTWGLERDSKIQQNLTALTKRQENEINSFKQKILAGAEELKKMKVTELEAIMKKYQNLRKEMKITHKLEKNRFDGKHTTGCGTSRLDLNQSSRAIFNLRTPASSRPATAAENRPLMSSVSLKSLGSPNACIN